MFWLDYTVRSYYDGSFSVEGDWPKEVMGYGQDGKPGWKDHYLYQPGDVFVVDEEGILRKQEPVTQMIYNYEANKR